ncbi:MAG: hypothetical protein EOM24_17245 [Chloroflexia bacterium]|nr:hypothetical protein [Chloroflexia bacterium]
MTLDNGQPIHCTPDHEFLTRDGQLRQAHELKPGDSLMPLYRQLVRGYEAVYQPLNGHLLPTHRLADEWNVRHGLYEDSPDTHRHHRDYNRRNNNPWNIERMDASEHIRLHNANTFGADFDPDSHSLAIRDAIAHLRLDPEWEDHFKQLQTNKARSFWNDEAYAQAREERNASIRASGMRNHKVAAIRDLGGDHDVYCLTVPEAGNFALEAGVFVRNCGIIINVTPLEPEWHGFVTIEISNTTPLPARIYANEGIGQVLFLESDEACEVSYADKRGKYQDQHGIVLPRIDRKA